MCRFDFPCVWARGTMALFGKNLSVQRCLTFATGLVECLCFAGAVFGWASLVFVLKSENYFSSLCINTTESNGTQVLGEFQHLTSPPQSSCAPSNISKRFQNRLKRCCDLFFLSVSDCSRQDEQFSLVFTTASFMNNFMTLLSGFLFDHFGTMVTRFCAVWVQIGLTNTETTSKKQCLVAHIIKNCCNKCITKTSNTHGFLTQKVGKIFSFKYTDFWQVFKEEGWRVYEKRGA